MTPAQLTKLKTAILAETNNTFVGYRNNGQTDLMAEWLNQSSQTDAWMDAAERRTIFEAIDLTKFDALTAGKRDSWRLLMDNAPIDFGRNKMRQAVVDVWGATDSVPVLQGLLEKATRAQALLGGNTKTTNTVAGLDRAFMGFLSGSDISAALAALGDA